MHVVLLLIVAASGLLFGSIRISLAGLHKAIQDRGGGTEKTGEKSAQVGRNPLLGCWQAEDGSLLRFETVRNSSFSKKKGLQFFHATYEPGKVLLRRPFSGDKDDAVMLSVEVKGDKLFMETKGRPKKKYCKLDAVPRELEVQPVRLGKTKPLPPEKIQAVQEQLARRFQTDQSVRTNDLQDPAERAQAARTERIPGLFQKLGGGSVA